MTFDIETRFDKELEAFTQDCGDHDYVKRGRLIRWLSQFGEDKIPLAIKVLKNIRYFGASNLMSMSQELVNMVIDHVSTRKRKRYILRSSRGTQVQAHK